MCPFEALSRLRLQSWAEPSSGGTPHQSLRKGFREVPATNTPAGHIRGATRHHGNRLRTLVRENLYPPTDEVGKPTLFVPTIIYEPAASRTACATRSLVEPHWVDGRTPPARGSPPWPNALTCDDPSARPARIMKLLKSRCLSRSALAKFLVSMSAGFAVPITFVRRRSLADTLSCSHRNWVWMRRSLPNPER